jgi:hypothetical protein
MIYGACRFVRRRTGWAKCRNIIQVIARAEIIYKITRAEGKFSRGISGNSTLPKNPGPPIVFSEVKFASIPRLTAILSLVCALAKALIKTKAKIAGRFFFI